MEIKIDSPLHIPKPVQKGPIYTKEELEKYAQSTLNDLWEKFKSIQDYDYSAFKKVKTHTVEIPQFITHVKLSEQRRPQYFIDKDGNKKLKNKHTVGKPKYKKINTQWIYSGGGKTNFTRAEAVRQMKKLLSDEIQKQFGELKITKFPISIHFTMYNVRNYERVKTEKGRIGFKKPDRPMAARWDMDNQWVWRKAFNDVLMDLNIIPEDTVDYVRKYSEEVVFVEEFEDRKLVFQITENL